MGATSLHAYFPPPSLVDFIRTDVEGADVEVLRGIRHLSPEYRPLTLLKFDDEVILAGRSEPLCREPKVSSSEDLTRTVECYSATKKRGQVLRVLGRPGLIECLRTDDA